MRRSLRDRLLCGVIVVVAVTIAPAAAQERPPTPPGIGIRLMDAPVDRAHDPRATAYIVDHLEPGVRLERRIELSNGTGRPAELQLYSSAADIAAGHFRAAEGRTANELARWISVEPPVVQLEPGGRAMATVRIAVPAAATAGERYAAVLAEHAPRGRAPADVAVVTRVGVRVYLSVGGSSEPSTDFSILSLTASRDESGGRLDAVVRNSGGRAVDLLGEATLADGPGGIAAGPFHVAPATTVRPGDSGVVQIRLPSALPGGSWSARLTLRSGDTSRSVTARVDLSSPGEAMSPGGVLRESTSELAPAPRDHRRDKLRQFADALLDGIAFPVAMAIAVALFLLVQHCLDKRDRKIGLAPTDPDPLLRFE